MKIRLDLKTLDTEEGLRAGRCAVVLIMAMLPKDEVQLAIEQWEAWQTAEDVANARDFGQLYEVKSQVPATREPLTPSVGDWLTTGDVVGVVTEIRGEWVQLRCGPTGPYMSYPVDCLRRMTEADQLRPASVEQVADAVKQMVDDQVQPEPEPEAAPEPTPEPKPAKLAPSYESFTYGDRTFSVRKRGPSAALKEAFMEILSADAEELLGPLSFRLSKLKGIFEELDRHDLSEQVTQAFEARKAELAGLMQPKPAERKPTEPEREPEPVEVQLEAADEEVLYAGRQLRPMIARQRCLKDIKDCLTVEELELIREDVMKLVTALEKASETQWATEIRSAYTHRWELLVDVDKQEEEEEGEEVEEHPPVTMAKPAAPAQAGNGAGVNRVALVGLLRKAQNQFGTPWVNKLLKKHGANPPQVKHLRDAQLQAVWDEAEAALGG